MLVEGNLRPLSFIVDHNGVAPANCMVSTKGGNAQNPSTYPT
ncbi:hypothetical protein [Conexivisphaera calida]|uniref:Uncharacterized protein n=1 Tax=Conexivisphaera calida TaxID=1874277 RepID=A0A4P2VEY5_9ARCH|nr:hypothetical protein [Conexivisphaera calida]BBE42964.1 hypothetical protein NAS2_1587 [Conexivisphaera calida]